LERWNPDSLTFAGKSVTDGGVAVDGAVTKIGAQIKTMPETKAWSGDAHTAATGMFVRAGDQTEAFSGYTTAIGVALSEGAGTIGGARTALLNKADQIDMSGQLHVSDQWVVLVTGGQMSIEEAAALEKRAQSEQLTVNSLLTAVGKADDDAAAKVMAAAKPLGFQAPDPTSYTNVLPGQAKPSDEVPNPLSTVGTMQQALLRDSDMTQTVRETQVETRYNPDTGEAVATTTTRYMLDGSKHLHTVNAKPDFSDRGPLTTDVHIDKNGNEVSRTTTVTYENWAQYGMAGKTTSTTQYANGTTAEVTVWPDGKETVLVRTSNGRHADVPINLIDHPIMSSLSAAAGELPGPGGKYGGPGISIATSLWDVAVADSGFEKCVAAAEGVTSVTTGALVGLATTGAGPWVSIPFALAAAGGGEAVGNWIGNTFCPR
jgi:hypothetical protein